MRFVKTDDLQTGMRIARPIYNKKGVLLYDSGSKLTGPAISSVRNFGLIGIFILDETEPVPPMTPEDIEFERFKAVKVFDIQAELKEMIATRREHRLEIIVNEILSEFGHRRTPLKLLQDIRSKEDYVYKHVLNVSILASIMAFHMNVSPSEKTDIVKACLVHDIGKLTVPDRFLEGEEPEEIERILDNSQETGFELLDTIFAATPNIKHMCVQAHNIRQSVKFGRELERMKQFVGGRILAVADAYDSMTAITTGATEPLSPISALRHLMEHPDFYNKKAVEALSNSVEILGPGTSVELSNGENALVLNINHSNVLQPMVLEFSSNTMIDLSNPIYSDLKIVDVVKTMDSRYVMDKL